MTHLHLFTDGSVNPQLKVGYGAYLLVDDPVLFDLDTPIESLKKSVQVKRFEQTSSTRLELQTVLWALGALEALGTLSETIGLAHGNDVALTVYTDSQNIMGLPGRQARLEQSSYFSRKNKRLRHYELYQEFYRLAAAINCDFVKVAGHQASSKKDKVHQLFGLVDQASRRALREDF